MWTMVIIGSVVCAVVSSVAYWRGIGAGYDDGYTDGFDDGQLSKTIQTYHIERGEDKGETYELVITKCDCVKPP